MHSHTVPIVPDYLYSLEHSESTLNSESASSTLKILPRINSTLLGPATRKLIAKLSLQLPLAE